MSEEEVPSEICCNRCKYSKQIRHPWVGWNLICGRVGASYQRSSVHPSDCYCEKFRCFKSNKTFDEIMKLYN